MADLRGLGQAPRSLIHSLTYLLTHPLTDLLTARVADLCGLGQAPRSGWLWNALLVQVLLTTYYLPLTTYYLLLTTYTGWLWDALLVQACGPSHP